LSGIAAGPLMSAGPTEAVIRGIGLSSAGSTGQWQVYVVTAANFPFRAQAQVAALDPLNIFIKRRINEPRRIRAKFPDQFEMFCLLEPYWVQTIFRKMEQLRIRIGH
jgi:hypothetical protein